MTAYPKHYSAQTVLGAALILSWAILLSAQCIAAAIYATKATGTYEAGLDRIGWMLPACAWIALAAGVFACTRSATSRKETAGT